MKITSVNNELVKETAKLLQRKYRDESGLFLLEGDKCIEEAIESGLEVVRIFKLEGYEKFPEGIETTEAVLAKVSSTSTPPKAVAVAKKPDIKWNLDYKKVVLLENIKDTLWAIGIGVNVEKAPVLEGMPYQATSLKESGLILDRIELLHYYLQQFLSDMQEYRKNGFDKIRREWLDMAKGYKEKIKIKTEREVKEGFFEDIDDNGYLILKTNKGTEKIIAGDLFI